MKEWLLWLVGWVVYPFIVLTDRGDATSEYHRARLALRDWLRSRPDREKRLLAHELTREPEGGW